MKKLLLAGVILLAIVFFDSNAQNNIDSLKIIPDNPTTVDSIKVICYSTFGSGGIFLTSSNINMNGPSIDIQTYYFVGGFAVITYVIDTIFIGNLSAGTYELVYEILDSSGTSFDLDTTDFIVSQTTTIENLQNSKKNSFHIYPNPVKENLIIKFEKTARDAHNISKITIIDIRGKKIYEQVTKKNKLIINGKVFSTKGVYFLKIEHDNNLNIIKIVKN